MITMWKFPKLVVVAILVATVYTGAVTGSKCNMPPSLWCSDGEVAENCGVLDQCLKSLTPDVAAQPVNFTLYYESLCPGCRDFFREQLYKTYQTLGDSVMNLTLVPYGNAKESKSPFGKWKFVCQHGKEECVGNLIETCAFVLEKTKTISVGFIHCMENSEKTPEKAAEACGPKFKIDLDKIMACANGDQGNQLEHMMAEITADLNPPHQYVPWVTLNGVHTNKIQNEAMSDLLSLICDAYKGPKPSACDRHQMMNVMNNTCVRH